MELPIRVLSVGFFKQPSLKLAINLMSFQGSMGLNFCVVAFCRNLKRYLIYILSSFITLKTSRSNLRPQVAFRNDN